MAWPSSDNTPKTESYGVKETPAFSSQAYDGTIYARDKSLYIWRTVTLNYTYRTTSLWTAVWTHWLSKNIHTSFTLPIWQTGAAVNKTVWYEKAPTMEHATANTLKVTVTVRFQESLT